MLKMKMLKLYMGLLVAGAVFSFKNFSGSSFLQNIVKAMESAEEGGFKGEPNKPLNNKEAKDLIDKTDQFNDKDFENSSLDKLKDFMSEGYIGNIYGRIKNLKDLLGNCETTDEEKYELTKIKECLYFIFCGIVKKVIDKEKPSILKEYVGEYDRCFKEKILNLKKNSGVFDFEVFNNIEYIKGFYIKTLDLINKLKEFEGDLNCVIKLAEQFNIDFFFRQLELDTKSFYNHLKESIIIIEDVKQKIECVFKENKININVSYKYEKLNINSERVKELNALLEKNKDLITKIKSEQKVGKQEVGKDVGVVENSKISGVIGSEEKEWPKAKEYEQEFEGLKKFIESSAEYKSFISQKIDYNSENSLSILVELFSKLKGLVDIYADEHKDIKNKGWYKEFLKFFKRWRRKFK